MERILLDNELSIKKLDPANEKDVWLAKELDKDKLICGKDGYLWSIEKSFKNTSYLLRNDIYQSPYAIYYNSDPIGYMELSAIVETIKAVDISYALLDIYRGRGYATKMLREISKIILMDIINDIEKISLIIDPNNVKSQMVAKRAGFISDGLSEMEHFEQGYISYRKTKTMLKKENAGLK